jgi:hypothetical protein
MESGGMAKRAKKEGEKTVKRLRDFSDFMGFCKRTNPDLHNRLNQVGKKQKTFLKLKQGHPRGYLRDKEWYSK